MMSTTNAPGQRKPRSVCAYLSELFPYAFDKGIVTVSVGLSQPKPAEKRIPVQSVS
jgi:hypothetical protein